MLRTPCEKFRQSFGRAGRLCAILAELEHPIKRLNLNHRVSKYHAK
ncbi:hypothetical protein BC2230_30956 [Burkholderia cepacia]